MRIGFIRRSIVAILLWPSVGVAQVGWTVGGNGNIFKSNDGGTNWSGTFPTSALLNSVHFRDATTGWIAGGQVILKTTDGGVTWVDKYTGGGALASVFFVDPNNGWAVGNSGVIAKSSNAGETWTETFPVSATLSSVYFINSNTGWVAGGQVILKTSNGGASWLDKYNGGGALNSVYFVNGSTGWAVGSSGVIAKSTDGGETWTETFPVSVALNSVYFASSTTGWIAGGQVLLKTTNGGATWVDKYTGGADLQSVYFLGASQGWAVGSNGTILKSTDGGETWTEQTHPTSATLESVVFVTAPTISVTVQTSPAGRTFSVDGISYSATQVFAWTPGSAHTVATTSPQSGGAGTQYAWTGWSDGGAISHSVSPSSSATYTATFKTQYLLTMTAGAGGSVNPASGYRDAGSSASISATPTAGFSFSGWAGSGTGSYSGANNPATITMNGPISEAGSFVANIPVTVQTSPTGRSFSVDGTSYSTTQAFSWTPGSTHTVATTSPQPGAAGTQYVWMGWSDAGAISHTVNPATGTTYTATFKTQYFLTTSAAAGGVVSPVSGYRDAASSVSINALPNAGFSFMGWTGSGTGSYSGPSNPAMVAMNGPITESANFIADVSVTVQTNPVGRVFTVDGTSHSTTQVFSWTPGSMHTIATSSPQAGVAGTRYVWIGWSDAGALSHTVSPNGNATYTATFKTQYFLTMTAGAGGSVGPVSDWNDEGAAVGINATPDLGYTFAGWAGGGAGSYSGENNPSMITMNGPISETGSFSAAMPHLLLMCPLDTVLVAVVPVQLDFSITNDGAASGTVDYAITDTAGWVPTMDGSTVLGPGVSGVVSVQVSVPPGAYDDSTRVSIRAVVHEVPQQGDSCTVMVRIPRVTDVGASSTSLRQTRLLPAVPNPFNPTTRIEFEVPAGTRVDLDVFTVNGNHVRSLVSEPFTHGGRYSVIWDGRDDARRTRASGVYIVRMRAGSEGRVARVVLLK